MKFQFPSWVAKQKLSAKIAIGCAVFLCLCLVIVPALLVIYNYRSLHGNPIFISEIENGEVNIPLSKFLDFTYFRLENVSDSPDFHDLEFKWDSKSSSWMVRHDRLFWKRFSQPKYIAGLLTIDFSSDRFNIIIKYPSGTWAFP